MQQVEFRGIQQQYLEQSTGTDCEVLQSTTSIRGYCDRTYLYGCNAVSLDGACSA